tara:strand:+ start:207 stop:446 length:240 start_codon:yes stop_codon:yes gene_type:complete
MNFLNGVFFLFLFEAFQQPSSTLAIKPNDLDLDQYKPIQYLRQAKQLDQYKDLNVVREVREVREEQPIAKNVSLSMRSH